MTLTTTQTEVLELLFQKVSPFADRDRVISSFSSVFEDVRATGYNDGSSAAWRQPEGVDARFEVNNAIAVSGITVVGVLHCSLMDKLEDLFLTAYAKGHTLGQEDD